MTKQFNIKRLFLLMSTAGVVGLSSQAMASAFQLWETDAASIGNYHAGVAAIADDASTAWYNSAGLIRMQNQEVIFGADAVVTDVRFHGTVGTNTIILPPGPQPVSTQGGQYGTLPFLHYAAPISDRFAFGLSIDAPFGLKTDYGNATFARYAATLTSLTIIDYSPSLAIGIIPNRWSIGFGPDLQKLSAEFDLTGTAFTPALDTQAHNDGSDYGWGYHIGTLVQITDKTRLGLNFHSKIHHSVSGHSTFYGPLATDVTGVPQFSPNLTTNITMPASTTFSAFHGLNHCWDLLGSVTYTQWSVLKDLILQNASGIEGGVSSDSILVTIPEHYKNSWNYSVGTNFHPNDQWILRTGIGFDQTPVQDAYRNLQLPDSDRIAVGLGAHFQATKAIGFDAGWTHVFGMNTRINNVSTTFGDQTATVNGAVASSADVYGLQIKWDIT